MWPASVFRFSPSVVAVLDAGDGCVVDVNPAFERVLGIARADAVGRRTVELGIWSSLETRASIWMRIRSEQRVCGDVVTMCSRGGELLNGRLHAEVFEHEGRHYVFALIQDVASGDGRALRTSEQTAVDS